MTADVRRELVAMLPRLQRFARTLARNGVEADDLLQGSCERALRALDTWVPGTRLDSWMFRIMRNHWIDTVRKRRPDRMSEPVDEAINLISDDGRKTTEAALELADVRARIAQLPEQLRSVLVLVCVEDMSYREAAEVLGIPSGTVMSRLSRARQALAAGMDELPAPPELPRAGGQS